jgi:hypothetical protein
MGERSELNLRLYSSSRVKLALPKIKVLSPEWSLDKRHGQHHSDVRIKIENMENEMIRIFGIATPLPIKQSRSWSFLSSKRIETLYIGR